MNRVTLLGKSGAKAELRETQNGTKMLSLAVATYERRSEGWETTWHRVLLFGPRAQMIAPLIEEGTELFIDGKLLSHQIHDKSGQTRYSVEILANWIRVIQPVTV